MASVVQSFLRSELRERGHGRSLFRHSLSISIPPFSCFPPSPSSMTIHIDWGSQQCLGHVDTVFFVAVNGWLCCNGCVASCFVCRIFSVRFVFMNVVQFGCRRHCSSVVISIVLLIGLKMTYFVFPTF